MTHFQNNDKANPACKLQIKFVYPNAGMDEKDLKNLQTLFIEKILNPSLSNQTPQKALDTFTSDYLAEFDRFAQYEDPDDSDETETNPEDENEYLYYLTLEDQIVYNKNNFISFYVEKHIFEGGAHGSNSIYGYVVNLTTGNLVTEDSFAGINYSQNLSSLMAKKLATENGVSNPQELENIGYINISDIGPNNNFTLDEKGITYYFNEYEIGAYFLGVTKIFIPYEELIMYTTDNSLIHPIIAL